MPVHQLSRTRADWRWVDTLFLKLWCKTPPPEPFEPRDTYDTSNPTHAQLPADPLKSIRRVYGARFHDAIRGRTLLDIGCGPGHQVIAAAQAGAAQAIGVDRDPVAVATATTLAVRHQVADRTTFVTDTQIIGSAFADVVLSRNSFEHFSDPAGILQQAYDALKPGGQFFITFGPSWWHPYGVHHMFMIRLPWAHAVFSRETILRVRQLYRPNQPTTWEGVSLNQMTVRKLLALVAASKFDVAFMRHSPIGPLPRWLTSMRLFREWTTADTSVILRK